MQQCGQGATVARSAGLLRSERIAVGMVFASKQGAGREVCAARNADQAIFHSTRHIHATFAAHGWQGRTTFTAIKVQGITAMSREDWWRLLRAFDSVKKFNSEQDDRIANYIREQLRKAETTR